MSDRKLWTLRSAARRHWADIVTIIGSPVEGGPPPSRCLLPPTGAPSSSPSHTRSGGGASYSTPPVSGRPPGDSRPTGTPRRAVSAPRCRRLGDPDETFPAESVDARVAERETCPHPAPPASTRGRSASRSWPQWAGSAGCHPSTRSHLRSRRGRCRRHWRHAGSRLEEGTARRGAAGFVGRDRAPEISPVVIGDGRGQRIAQGAGALAIAGGAPTVGGDAASSGWVSPWPRRARRNSAPTPPGSGGAPTASVIRPGAVAAGRRCSRCGPARGVRGREASASGPR